MSNLVDRTEYIGGSAASVIFHSNDYNSTWKLWAEKTGKVDPEWIENHHMARGNFMEPQIEKWVRENLDSTLNGQWAFDKYDDGGGHHDQIFVRHPEHPWIGGHPDGIGQDEYGNHLIWEFKAPTMRSGVKKVKKYGLNDRYFYQVQHYMMVTGIEFAKVAVWDYDEWDAVVIDVPASPELHAEMLEEYKNFWHFVQIEVPPPAPIEKPEMAQPVDDEKLDELLHEYHQAYRQYYDAEETRDRLKGQILTLLRGRSGAITENYTAKVQRNVGKYNYTRMVVTPT